VLTVQITGKEVVLTAQITKKLCVKAQITKNKIVLTVLTA
jgi:hypothetical protein